MFSDTPTRRAPAIDNHGHPSSFSIQEFGDLVSTALDMQRVTENTLALSLKSPKQSRRSNRAPRDTDASRSDYNPSRAFRSLRGAIMRRLDSRNALTDASPLSPPSVPFANETRRLASSSVPALHNYIQPNPERVQRVQASASLTNLDNFIDSVFNSGMPPIITPVMPLSPTGLALTSSGGNPTATPVRQQGTLCEIPVICVDMNQLYIFRYLRGA